MFLKRFWGVKPTSVICTIFITRFPRRTSVIQLTSTFITCTTCWQFQINPNVCKKGKTRAQSRGYWGAIESHTSIMWGLRSYPEKLPTCGAPASTQLPSQPGGAEQLAGSLASRWAAPDSSLSAAVRPETITPRGAGPGRLTCRRPLCTRREFRVSGSVLPPSPGQGSPQPGVLPRPGNRGQGPKPPANSPQQLRPRFAEPTDTP